MALCSPRKHDDVRGVSLCAGVGGLDLGLHLAVPGYRTVCHVERNSFAAAALVARMADASLAAAPVWDDLRSFDGKPWRGKVHLVSAGYPCQPFTLSGLRQGEDDPRHLWPDVARIIGEIAPAWCFFENVPGHLTLGFRDVVSDLQRLGYVVAARVQSAAEVGASHRRDRLFILAHADVQGVGQQGLSDGGARGLKFQHDLNQTGKQVGIKNAASAWTLFWDILMASGWEPGPFPLSHRVRVSFGCGEKYSKGGPSLNPAFTDLMMGWPMGWTDPLQPVTGWSQWLRQGRLLS